MNKILKLALILFLVCAIVAGVLGAVNNLTAPSIQAQADAKTAAAYAAVLEAIHYDDAEYDTDAHPTVSTVSIGYDADGNVVGYVVTSTFSGAQGLITMITGVSPDYTCTGISITDHSETSGLGANAASSSEIGVNFRAQFVGKDDSVTVSDIDALSGATITSTAVTNAVAESIKTVESLG